VWRTHRFLPAIVVGAIALSACAASPKPITFDTETSGPSTTSAVTTVATPTSVVTTRPSASSPTPTTTSFAPVTARWTPVTANLTGLPSECGNMSLVSVRPDRDMLVASVAQQGLWSSANGATQWSPLGRGAGSATVTNRGSSIVYDPEHLDTFWESGIYNGGGVYRTDDNGATFRQLGSISHVDAVSVDLTDPARRTLLASRHESGTVYRSTDGGTTWTTISGSLPYGIGFATGPFVVNAQTYLLGTNHGTKTGIYRTTNGGATWVQAFSPGAVGQPLVTRPDGALYWTLENGGIVKSTNGGVSWEQVTRAGTINQGSPQVVQLPDGNLAAVGNSQVILSADAGRTWRAAGPGMPYAPNGFAYSPFRNAFYIWHFDCNVAASNALPRTAIMSLAYNYKTQ
jgi:photosystem II stability/assembly factor-like uncharacterized protein